MYTDRIQALICALDEGSLMAAAEKLGYTASGISRMRTALEEETGFPLLARSRRGVEPTDECRQLLPAMRDMIAAEERYRQMAGELAGLSRGTIRIGTSYYAYYEWFARMIAGFGKMYPGITVEITEGTSTQLLRAMSERRTDLCIISRREGDFDWIPLKEDELLACLPADSASARKKSFPVTAFESEDFIELYPGKETDNSKMFDRCGIRPDVKFSTSDNYAAYTMVKAGLGITCTNAIIADSFTEGVVYLPLDPPQKVEIGMAMPRKKELSPAARRFAEFAAQRFEAGR